MRNGSAVDRFQGPELEQLLDVLFVTDVVSRYGSVGFFVSGEDGLPINGSPGIMRELQRGYGRP